MDVLTLPLDHAAIERMLPHRYPFLLVDRIIEFEADKRIVGIKNVTLNERYLAHRDGERPALPPTILTEAIAQVGAIMILAKPENRGRTPFFAITHDPGLSPRREFVIDSAGFWVQEATNEVILSRRPNLRREHAPFVKGVFAFNVGASIAYAGAAFARTGPIERDTRGMADALGWKEPYVGLLILVPAVLDAVRFYHPDAKWAAWGSRAAKVGGVVLIAR